MLKGGKIDDFFFSLHFHATFPLPLGAKIKRKMSIVLPRLK